MDQSNLTPATLATVTESNEEPHLSLRGVVDAKLWARRRRHSLFVPQRSESDFGNAFLTHADFPKIRAKSLSALGCVRKQVFDKQETYRILEQTVNMELSFKSYDAKECFASSHEIAKMAKEKICSMFWLSGYKVICLCYITKRAKPSLAIDSGCAWDELKITVDKDAFVDYVYKNHGIVAVAAVFVIQCQSTGSKKTGINPLGVPGSLSLPKTRSATISEPARKRKDSGVFF